MVQSTTYRDLTPYHDHRRKRIFALGYGAKGAQYSKIKKIEARSSLEAGLIATLEGLIPDGQQAHFLVDSADKKIYNKTVAAGSGRP